MTEGAKPKRIRTLRTKIRGVTHRNDDGTERQRLAKKCRPGDDLVLHWEKDNPHDENAVAIHHPKFGKLGYLSRDLSPDIVGYFDRGFLFSVEVLEVTGGGFLSGNNRGINIEIGVYNP